MPEYGDPLTDRKAVLLDQIYIEVGIGLAEAYLDLIASGGLEDVL